MKNELDIVTVYFRLIILHSASSHDSLLKDSKYGRIHLLNPDSSHVKTLIFVVFPLNNLNRQSNKEVFFKHSTLGFLNSVPEIHLHKA